MNRISLFLVTLMLFTGLRLNSQTTEGTEGTTVLNYTGLQNKLKKSDADIQDPKKNIKIKTWISRADLMLDIFNVNNVILRKGMAANQVKIFYKEPLEVRNSQEGADQIEDYVYEWVTIKMRNGVVDDWTETKKIIDNPLGEAKKAIEEAIKLNSDGKANSDIVKEIEAIKVAYESDAVLEYGRKNFKQSHDDFSEILDLNKQPVMNNKIDTIIIYNAGRAAFEDSNYTVAEKHFDDAAALDFKEPLLYIYRKQCLFQLGDTAKGVEVIKEGFNKYPDNQSIQIELINYYLTTNQGDEALKLLALAKAADPNNVSYVFAEGTVYDKLGRFEEARDTYEKCIEMNPDYFDANYNLGVLYYNRAKALYESAAKITDNAEYEKAKEEADGVLMKAIPYFERASEINPDDRSPLDNLKTIYYRMKMNDKYQEVVSKLNSF